VGGSTGAGGEFWWSWPEGSENLDEVREAEETAAADAPAPTPAPAFGRGFFYEATP
jgi:hypothetical protein